MKLTLFFFLLGSFQISSAQESKLLLKKIFKAQEELKYLSYDINRVDTFASGTIRSKFGKVLVEADKNDNILGFKFHAISNDSIESYYTGKMSYVLDKRSNTYVAESNPARFSSLRSNPAGQLTFTSIVKLDTTGVSAMDVREDQTNYYLTFYYPDDSTGGTFSLHRIFTIDKSSYLPVAMRQRLITLDKIQSHNYFLSSLKYTPFEFTTPDKFLYGLTEKIENRKTNVHAEFIGKDFKEFTLTSFDGKLISSKELKNKLVLLDFWEVWCGPCIMSMSKIDSLYKKYKHQNFSVVGLINETASLESARQLVKRKKVSFINLIGNDQLKEDYKLNGVPLYVLIDKTGKILLMQEGYSEDIETMIKNILSKPQSQ